MKVIRPGVRRRFFHDLESYFLAARLQEKYIPSSRRLRPVEVTETLAQTTKIEMDLRLEAAALSELGENTKDDPGFRVPSVDWERTGRDVLTMEWVDGVKMNDIAGLVDAGHDLKAIAANLIQSFLRHTLRDGFFHADMHPGNLFVEANGTIVAVDLGIAGRLGKKERRFLAEILYGFITRDYLRVAEVHFEAGYVPRQHNVAAFAQAIRAIGEPIHGQPAETISMAKLLTLLFEVTELFDMATRPELILLQKTMVVVEGVARTLDPAFNMWKTSEPVVGDWIAGNLGPRGLLDRCARWRQGDAGAGPSGAGPCRPHRAAVARDRPDGRARPALRRGDRTRHRQGRGALYPLRPAGAVGDRADAGLYRLETALSACNDSSAVIAVEHRIAILHAGVQLWLGLLSAIWKTMSCSGCVSAALRAASPWNRRHGTYSLHPLVFRPRKASTAEAWYSRTRPGSTDSTDAKVIMGT